MTRWFTFPLACSLLLLWLAYSCQPASKEGADQETLLSPEEAAPYVEKGKAIAQASFAALSGRLGTALERGGVSEAVSHCSLVALPVADSLSEVHQAIIRRTSLKVRNPEDAPNALEARVLRTYEQDQQDGRPLQPSAYRVNESEIAFFAPITIQPLCLQCHGQVGQDIADEDYALIRRLYPNDQATGYRLGEWRGLWSIRFPDGK